MNNKIFFTSDLHFGHNREFLYGPRGFTNIRDHDEAIIDNWNAVVTPSDTVYVLGDLMLGNSDDLSLINFNCLNGHKHIILGNHDSQRRQVRYSLITDIKWADVIRYQEYEFFLCHYPTLTDNFDRHRKRFNLHGHTHSKDKFQFIEHCCYNVALDAHNNTPVDIETIIRDLQEMRKENNYE